MPLRKQVDAAFLKVLSAQPTLSHMRAWERSILWHPDTRKKNLTQASWKVGYDCAVLAYVSEAQPRPTYPNHYRIAVNDGVVRSALGWSVQAISPFWEISWTKCTTFYIREVFQCSYLKLNSCFWIGNPMWPNLFLYCGSMKPHHFLTVKDLGAAQTNSEGDCCYLCSVMG